MVHFRPVTIGSKGRRAIAWFTNDGLVVQATDASAAGHAMAVVLEALVETHQAHHVPRFMSWAEDAVRLFPLSPADDFAAREQRLGVAHIDVETDSVGYGYVKPAAGGYECGGALFFPSEHRVRLLDPAHVWISGVGQLG
jgi:hypothetical protein